MKCFYLTSDRTLAFVVQPWIGFSITFMTENSTYRWPNISRMSLDFGVPWSFIQPYTVSLVCNTTYRPHWKALYLAQNVCSQHTTHSKSHKNYSDLLHLPQDYIRDIGLWMEENKLKLNNDETKAICFRSSSVNTTSQHHGQSLSISDTEFAGIVHNLSFIFDSNLSSKHVRLHALKSEA